MLKLTVTLLLWLFSFAAFSQSSCSEIDQQIRQTQKIINGIHIPELTYVVDDYNCSQVEPVLAATYDIETHLSELLELYQTLYFDCGMEVDLIYLMEDVKINIILMQTLSALAKNLHQQCGY